MADEEIAQRNLEALLQVIRVSHDTKRRTKEWVRRYFIPLNEWYGYNIRPSELRSGDLESFTDEATRFVVEETGFRPAAVGRFV